MILASHHSTIFSNLRKVQTTYEANRCSLRFLDSVGGDNISVTCSHAVTVMLAESIIICLHQRLTSLHESSIGPITAVETYAHPIMPTIIISTLTITETICPAALQEADFSSPDVRGAYNRLIRINIILAYYAEMEQTGSPYGLTNADRHRCVMPPPLTWWEHNSVQFCYGL